LRHRMKGKGVQGEVLTCGVQCHRNKRDGEGRQAKASQKCRWADVADRRL
jgi:hypothetical protein